MTDRSVALRLGHARLDGAPVALPLPLLNRHGLIAGATGTGKTITVQTLAKGLSDAGVPVFLSDAKGDLSGLSRPGTGEACPVAFWDTGNQYGQPLRVGLGELGPDLIARLLALTPAQQEGLTIAFRLAREQENTIVTLDDLRLWLLQVSQISTTVDLRFGTLASASLSAIRRKLLVLEEIGGLDFFDQPAFEAESFIQRTQTGQGQVNLLLAADLIRRPAFYAIVLTTVLDRTFAALPEVGDEKRPRLVFIFDEAHLLFRGATSEFVQRIETLVRMGRSKGIGLYFATQSPGDIPVPILSQLAHLVVHGLRPNSIADRKAIATLANRLAPLGQRATMRKITTLSIGQAIVSGLDTQGRPTDCVETQVDLPKTHIGPVEPPQQVYAPRSTERPGPSVAKPRLVSTLSSPIAQKPSLKQRSSYRSMLYPIAWHIGFACAIGLKWTFRRLLRWDRLPL